MSRRIAVGLVFLVVFVAYPCHSLDIRGKASTVLYGWQTRDESDSSSLHLIVSEQLQVDARDILVDGLSLFGYFRALKEFAPRDSTEFSKVMKIYNLYLQYSQRKWGSLRLGRQLLSYGVARGSMDGANIRFRLPKIAEVVGFTGVGVSSESLAVQSWDKSRVIGGQLSVLYLPKTRISTSYVQKAVGDTNTEQKLGFAVRFLPRPGLRPFVRGTYDIVNRTLSKVHVGLFNNQSDKLSMYVSYTYVQPTFAEGSFFQSLSGDAHNRIRLGTTYKSDWIATFTGTAVTTVYGGATSHYFELSADGEWMSVGVVHSFGHGGVRTGAFANADYPVLPGLDLAVGLDYARYRIGSDEETSWDENDIAAYVGGTWNPLRNIVATTRIESLVNEEYEYDIKFLSTLSVGFGI